MYLSQFFVEGLGHTSYLIASDQTKEAAVVDPGREIQPYLDRARRAGVKIRAVIETHLHNDFVSGAKQLAARVGAEHLAPAGARLTYRHQTARDGHVLTLGELLPRAGELDPARHTVVICGTGTRSSIGTSLLLRRGFGWVINVLGGMTAWKAAGYPTTPARQTVDEQSGAEQLPVDDAGQFRIPPQAQR